MLVSTSTKYLAKLYGEEKAVEMIVNGGFTAVDFTMCALDRAPFVDGYRELAERLLKITDAAGAVFNQAHAPFVTNTERYENEIRPLMPRVFEMASLLGIKNVVVHPRKEGRYYGNEAYLFEKNVEFYSSIKQAAKDNGVKIALENMWQRHPVTKRIVTDVCAPPEELLRLYDTLNDPEAFTVCLDIGHAALTGIEPEDAIRIIGNRIGCLHVHDVDYKDDIHTLPGVGKINWDKVCRALADIDYRGDITLEAGNFYLGFLPEMHGSATRFMADTAKSLADKIEFYKTQK